MGAIWKALNGNKTYLGMIGLGVLGFIWTQGWIDEQLAKSIGALLTAWTGVAVRHAWAKGK